LSKKRREPSLGLAFSFLSVGAGRSGKRSRRGVTSNRSEYPVAFVQAESVYNLRSFSFTAHILGGCHMGSSLQTGVIDTARKKLS